MSDQKKDGGPAFPGFPNTQQGRFPRDGMTLRDWLAGQALSASVAVVYSENGFKDLQGPALHSIIATMSYGLADAMITARDAKS